MLYIKSDLGSFLYSGEIEMDLKQSVITLLFSPVSQGQNGPQ